MPAMLPRISARVSKRILSRGVGAPPQTSSESAMKNCASTSSILLVFRLDYYRSFNAPMTMRAALHLDRAHTADLNLTRYTDYEINQPQITMNLCSAYHVHTEFTANLDSWNEHQHWQSDQLGDDGCPSACRQIQRLSEPSSHNKILPLNHAETTHTGTDAVLRQCH